MNTYKCVYTISASTAAFVHFFFRSNVIPRSHCELIGKISAEMAFVAASMSGSIITEIVVSC